MTMTNLSNINHGRGADAMCPELVVLTVFVSMNNGMPKLILKDLIP